MTSSSDRRFAPRSVPPPEGPAKPAHARFIPREELGPFASWTPGGFGSTGGAAPNARAQEPAPPAGPTPEQIQAALQEARQAGYQDGYRDGTSALEAFKQTFAQQMSAQLGQLVHSFDAQFAEMEHQMAEALARAATELARQVVRHEVSVNPALVAGVAAEAVNTVLMSARHIHVHVNPQDQALVAQGAAEALQARGARLMPSPQVARGGCLIESDAGNIDARIESRWQQAAAAMGQEDVAWDQEGTNE